MSSPNPEHVFGDERLSYQSPPPKRGIGKYILIGLAGIVILGLGTCVWGLGSLTQVAAERQPATDAFVEQVLASGLPDADSDIWMGGVGFDAETLGTLQNVMDHFAGTEEVGSATCNAQSMMRTNGPSGTFVFCVVPASYPTTKGRFEMTWKKEEDNWKIVRFYLHYDDMSSYYEAEARKKIELENMTEEMLGEVNVPDKEGATNE